MDLEHRVVRYAAQSVLSSEQRHLFVVDRALDRRPTEPAVDMRVIVRRLALHPLPSSVENLRPPGVVVPVHERRRTLRRRMHDEPLIGLICVHVGVETYEYF